MDATAVQRQPLKRWERWAIGLFFVVLVLFGFEVEHKSAFLSRRMGDLGCYLRAAWAVRAGVSMYDVVDDNLWHYNYPPLYALLMTPLADPPTGVDHTGFIPYEVSAGIMYVVNVLFLAVGIHVLASALERSSASEAVRSLNWRHRRWWLLRTLPVLTCLPPIGHTLMRGQTNLLLLALLCGLIAGLVRGRSFLAGLCLAGAICLKIFPAFLLLILCWRRDWRGLTGCATGLLVGLVLVPLAALGPRGFVSEYTKLTEVLIKPALGMGKDTTRAEELTEVNATDNQSIQTTLHNTLYPDRDTRPKSVEPWLRRTAWLIGGGFTLVTLLAALCRGREKGSAAALFVGALTLVMIWLSPVCHSHYFVLSAPLVMVLLWRSWERQPRVLNRFAALSLGLFVLVAVQIIGYTIPLFQETRDLGVSLFTSLPLWFLACVALWRRDPVAEVGQRATRNLSSPLAA